MSLELMRLKNTNNFKVINLDKYLIWKVKINVSTDYSDVHMICIIKTYCKLGILNPKIQYSKCYTI